MNMRDTVKRLTSILYGLFPVVFFFVLRVLNALIDCGIYIRNGQLQHVLHSCLTSTTWSDTNQITGNHSQWNEWNELKEWERMMQEGMICLICNTVTIDPFHNLITLVSYPDPTCLLAIVYCDIIRGRAPSRLCMILQYKMASGQVGPG